jgi:hypothetical protein
VRPCPLISTIYFCLERQALSRTSLSSDPKTLPRMWALQRFLPRYLAKETIGYTPAPSALPQYQLRTPYTSLKLRHNKPLLKLSHQSPRELYTWAARHTAVHPVSKNAKMSEMAEMSNMTARHVMCSLGEPAV